MSWIDDAQVETKEEKLLARIERNKQKAIAAQMKGIEKAEEDDLKAKYDFGTQLDTNSKKAVKDYIKAIQADIDTPSLLEDYEPIALGV